MRDYNERLPRVKACIFNNSGQWTPEMERSPALGEVCKNCGARHTVDGMVGGKVTPGSRLYCPSCHITGFESQIASMLAAEKKAAACS